MESITSVLIGHAASRDFDCHDLYRFVIDNHYALPLGACVAYVLLIFVLLPLLRPAKSGSVSRNAFAAWNFGLSAFSTIGVVTCVPYIIRVFNSRPDGVWYLVCSDDMMLGADRQQSACYGDVGFMMSLFMLSKFPELLDTVFLVWMRKPVIFLHWYHHITVLLYSWFAYRVATPTAVFFGTMNYTVHSIMYFYFGASMFTRSLGFLRQPITSLQLLQMFFGMCGTAAAYYYTYYDARGCSSTYTDSGFFFYCGAIYFSYFLLFAKLFFDSYISPSSRSGKGETKGRKSAPQSTPLK
mgnify:CR=1 FL=1